MTDNYTSSLSRSGESEERAARRLIGLTARAYNWCFECADQHDREGDLPVEAEDIWARGNTMRRCSFCGRKLTEVSP